MSGFTAAAVSTLDYDFTAIPAVGGVGFCTGKGIVAEPSDELLTGFFKALDDGRNAVIAAVEAGDANVAGTEQMDELRQTVVTFCNGTPSAEEIAQLPPRFLAAFVRWLTSELGGGDPKG